MWRGGNGAAIRDSKNRGPTLEFPAEAVTAFLEALKAGEFTLPG